VAQRHNVAVIEDAAEALGSEYHGHRAGSFGAASAFSFHGSKTMTTGEGGMLVTDDRDLHDRVRFLADHGRLPGDKLFFNAEVAYKYKMSSMQAALGLAQVERADELVARKRQIFAWYAERLRGVDGLQLNYEPPDTRNSYWMVTAVLSPRLGLTKQDLMQHLESNNIDGRPFFFPLSALPAYEGRLQAAVARERNAVAYRLTPYGINLPSGQNLSEDQVDYVCGVLLEALSLKAVSK
jgi:perosamine synthetase